MADTAKWYVVHTYSGYENTVKATIEKTVLADEQTQKYIEGKQIVKVIIVPKRIVNIVLK